MMLLIETWQFKENIFQALKLICTVFPCDSHFFHNYKISSSQYLSIRCCHCLSLSSKHQTGPSDERAADESIIIRSLWQGRHLNSSRCMWCPTANSTFSFLATGSLKGLTVFKHLFAQSLNKWRMRWTGEIDRWRRQTWIKQIKRDGAAHSHTVSAHKTVTHWCYLNHHSYYSYSYYGHYCMNIQAQT